MFNSLNYCLDFQAGDCWILLYHFFTGYLFAVVCLSSAFRPWALESVTTKASGCSYICNCSLPWAIIDLKEDFLFFSFLFSNLGEIGQLNQEFFEILQCVLSGSFYTIVLLLVVLVVLYLPFSKIYSSRGSLEKTGCWEIRWAGACRTHCPCQMIF